MSQGDNHVHINIPIKQNVKICRYGTSLVVQRLRLQALNAGGQSSIPGQGTRLHMLQPRSCMPQLKKLHPQRRPVVVK